MHWYDAILTPVPHVTEHAVEAPDWSTYVYVLMTSEFPARNTVESYWPSPKSATVMLIVFIPTRVEAVSCNGLVYPVYEKYLNWELPM